LVLGIGGRYLAADSVSEVARYPHRNDGYPANRCVSDVSLTAKARRLFAVSEGDIIRQSSGEFNHHA
jgi:hypothetical protein